MKYCSDCGESVNWSIPDGDNRPRYHCQACGAIHYQNPKLVTGVVPIYEGKILLCRRAIEPRYGYWTLPAGFMENLETVEDAAKRETWEEACAKVNLGPMISMITVTHISQVHVFFTGELIDGEYAVGEESLEVKLFHPSEIPWDELSFPSVGITLKHYLEHADRNSQPDLLIKNLDRSKSINHEQ